MSDEMEENKTCNNVITRNYMKTYRQRRRTLFPTKHKPNPIRKKEVLQSFGVKVVSVSMAKRFVIVGLENGQVDCIYRHGRVRKWRSSVSQHPITAVLTNTWETLRDTLFHFPQPLPITAETVIYAGDKTGQIYLLNQKGTVLAQVEAREGPIFALHNKNIGEVIAYSEGGSTVIGFIDKQLVRKKTKISKFSMDNDGVFYTNREMGDIPMEVYKSEIPASVDGSPLLQLDWDGEKSYIFATAFGIVSSRFRELIENGVAPATLDVVDHDHNRIRVIEFDSPVRQVLNCFMERPADRRDAVYVLLWNDDIIRFSMTELADSTICNDDLKKILVFQSEQSDSNTNDGDISSFSALGGELVFISKAEEDVLYTVKDEEEDDA